MADIKATPSFVTRAISFDNPNLIWYSVIQPGDDAPEGEDEDDDDDSFMDIALPQPEPEPEVFDDSGYAPLLSDTLRYCYYVSYSKDGKEIYSNLGKVTSIDLEKSWIGVDFHEDDENTGLRNDISRLHSNSPQKLSFSKNAAADDEKDDDDDKDNLFWIPYTHPYLYWFNKEKELLKSRKELEAAQKNNESPRGKPGQEK
jgi:hypothetical protein